MAHDKVDIQPVTYRVHRVAQRLVFAVLVAAPTLGHKLVTPKPLKISSSFSGCGYFLIWRATRRSCRPLTLSRLLFVFAF
jgi:hypothetical protein